MAKKNKGGAPVDLSEDGQIPDALKQDAAPTEPADAPAEALADAPEVKPLPVVNVDDAATMGTLTKDQIWAVLQATNDELIQARRRFDADALAARRAITEMERRVRKLGERHRK